MKKRYYSKLLIFLILVLFAINYSYLDNQLTNFLDTREEIHVDRIIDGDTIESNGTSIRFLGINTPERGEIGYQQAKDFLSQEILNKTVILEFIGEREDKYDRTLAYVFLKEENINVKMVEKGYANYYFYDGLDKYSKDLKEAWNICIENKINLCEPSQNICSPCIEINSYSIVNSCSFSCDINSWTIKGEGREKFVFNGTLDSNMESEFSLDLENSGGSLFLRDEKGKLVSWKD